MTPLRGAVALAGAGLVAASFGRFEGWGDALVAAYIVAVLAAVSVFDIERGIIPNRIVVPAAAIVLVSRIALTPGRTIEWVVSAVGAAGFLLLCHLVYPAGMGMGDVKLALLLGAALGKLVVAALLLGTVGAGLVGVAVILRRGAAARKQAIPFGPYLAVGTVVALFVGVP